jgi:hypothetical protein
MPPMTFAEAAAYRVNFGQYAGKTIDEIATRDRGLLWLEWARGEIAAADRPNFAAAVKAYLEDATIAKDLAALTTSQRGRR